MFVSNANTIFLDRMVTRRQLTPLKTKEEECCSNGCLPLFLLFKFGFACVVLNDVCVCVGGKGGV